MLLDAILYLENSLKPHANWTKRHFFPAHHIFRFLPLLLPSLSGSSSSVWQKAMFLCHMNALGSLGGNNEKISLPQGNHWKNLWKWKVGRTDGVYLLYQLNPLWTICCLGSIGKHGCFSTPCYSIFIEHCSSDLFCYPGLSYSYFIHSVSW